MEPLLTSSVQTLALITWKLLARKAHLSHWYNVCKALLVVLVRVTNCNKIIVSVWRVYISWWNMSCNVMSRFTAGPLPSDRLKRHLHSVLSIPVLCSVLSYQNGILDYTSTVSVVLRRGLPHVVLEGGRCCGGHILHLANSLIKLIQ